MGPPSQGVPRAASPGVPWGFLGPLIQGVPRVPGTAPPGVPCGLLGPLSQRVPCVSGSPRQGDSPHRRALSTPKQPAGSRWELSGTTLSGAGRLACAGLAILKVLGVFRVFFSTLKRKTSSQVGFFDFSHGSALAGDLRSFNSRDSRPICLTKNQSKHRKITNVLQTLLILANRTGPEASC